jgi:hypothetical protein
MWGLQRDRRLTRNAVVARPEADIGIMPASPYRCRNGNNDNATETLTIGVDRLVCRERARRLGKYRSLSNPLVAISALSSAPSIGQPTTERGKRSRLLRRRAMSEFKFQKYAQMCMRLAAECRELAADVPEPDLRVHFLNMASMWTKLADQPRVLH